MIQLDDQQVLDKVLFSNHSTLLQKCVSQASRQKDKTIFPRLLSISKYFGKYLNSVSRMNSKLKIRQTSWTDSEGETS